MIKKAYSIDVTNKIITIDDTVKRKQSDTDDIQFYINAGYVIRHKSKARSEAAKGRSDSLTADQIRKELASDKPALTQFETLLVAKGFFSAKKYFKVWKSEQTEKADTERGGMTAAELPKKPGRRGRKPKAAEGQTAATEAAEGQSESEG